MFFVFFFFPSRKGTVCNSEMPSSILFFGYWSWNTLGSNTLGNTLGSKNCHFSYVIIWFFNLFFFSCFQAKSSALIITKIIGPCTYLTFCILQNSLLNENEDDFLTIFVSTAWVSLIQNAQKILKLFEHWHGTQRKCHWSIFGLRYFALSFKCCISSFWCYLSCLAVD